MDWSSFAFAHPAWLLALLALPLAAWLRGKRPAEALVLPFAHAWHRGAAGPRPNPTAALLYLGCAGLALGLARPQLVDVERRLESSGYDIMLAIDLSRSMLAEDYRKGMRRLSRLEALKPILEGFIERRSSDRIGLVAFAGRAYTVAPLTFSHEWLARQTERLEIGLIEDGTAIGDAVAVAVDRLEEGAKERAGKREGAFIVLLTDGENTAGALEPKAAAELAAESGARLFAIAAGRQGAVPIPVYNDQGERVGYEQFISRVDEALLREMARMADGEFFRAEDLDTTERAFAAIDQASKTEFESRQIDRRKELFPYLAAPAAALFLIAGLLAAKTGKEALA